MNRKIDFGPFKLRYEKLTEDDLLRDREAEPFISWAIRHRIFEFLPKKAITKKVLLHPILDDEGYGETKIIHFLAKDIQFKGIPKEILTEELLSTKGRLGESVYHVLAKNNKLHLLPGHAFSTEKLTKIKDSIEKEQNWKGITNLKQLHNLVSKELSRRLSKISDKALHRLAAPDSLLFPLVQKEIVRRKIMKELSQKEQGIAL